MNEYDRNFAGRRHCRACRAGAGGENDVDFSRQKLAGRRLQRGAIAFDIAGFKKQIFSLLVAESFEFLAQAFDSLGLGTAHLLDQDAHSQPAFAPRPARERQRQRKLRSKR